MKLMIDLPEFESSILLVFVLKPRNPGRKWAWSGLEGVKKRRN
jgi:hypothetical protein